MISIRITTTVDGTTISITVWDGGHTIILGMTHGTMDMVDGMETLGIIADGIILGIMEDGTHPIIMGVGMILGIMEDIGVAMEDIGVAMEVVTTMDLTMDTVAA